jgi:hypothetical protein
VKKLGTFQKIQSLKENQTILFFKKWTIFNSYNSIIAINIYYKKIYLNNSCWDYSSTTWKYRNIFLNEKRKETEEKIKNKEYLLFE